MRKILALMAVFAITASPALAFDHSTGPVGQVYFSIPFGAPTLEQAMPRLGFRFDHGYRQAFDDADVRIPYSLADWSLNLDGQTSLRLNGVDAGRLSRTLSAAENGGIPAGNKALLGLIGVSIGVGIYFRTGLND